jgi:hypothetical protein
MDASVIRMGDGGDSILLATSCSSIFGVTFDESFGVNVPVSMRNVSDSHQLQWCRSLTTRILGRGIFVEQNESHYLHDGVELIERVSNVLLGQIIGHVEHVQRECLLRTAWDGDLRVVVVFGIAIEQRFSTAVFILFKFKRLGYLGGRMHTYLPVKTSSSDFVEPLFKHNLIVFGM